MIDSLITSKTRIKILLKFFLNSQTTGYLRNLETEFAESTNSIRIELNKLEKAGLLISTNERNRKLFYANTNHPLFSDINSILKKFVGIDQIIEHITSKIGDLKAAYLTGSFAEGKNSNHLDLALVGEHLDQLAIDELIEKAEKHVHRRIICTIMSKDELSTKYLGKPVLLIWNAE